MSDQIKIDLDPKKVLDALSSMSEGTKNLAKDIDESLGKDSVKSMGKLEDAARNGSNKLVSFFRNAGTQVKEDLKTAFDLGAVMQGAKVINEMAGGVKQVFEMERAFDRLNTRLQLSNRELSSFKTTLGKRIAGTGQKLEDVLPGVETVVSKGNVRDAKQLSAIGEMLGQVRSTTGENTENLADSVVEILKNQGEKITASTFKKTLDTLQAARVQGSFKSAGEAGQALEALSPYAKHLKLSTRELGGLSAVAGKAGEGGQNILQQLLARGSTIEGQQVLNSVFGRNLFKNGKLNASEIGKIDTSRFGKYSSQVMEEATGLHGASGQDLKRFIEAFSVNMKDFDNVVKGSNETASQFDLATDNLASKVDRFKEGMKEAGREIGSSISNLGNDLLKGNFKNLKGDLKNVGESIWENKGEVMGALAVTAGAGALAKYGLKGIFKGLGGGGGLASEAAGLAKDITIGTALKQAGITPVFVVNAQEIGNASQGRSGVSDIASTIEGMAGVMTTGGLGAGAGTAAAGTGIGSTIAGGAASLFTAIGAPLAALGSMFYSPSLGPEKGTPEWDIENPQSPINKTSNALKGSGGNSLSSSSEKDRNVSPEAIAKAVQEGTEKAHSNINKAKVTTYTNPSSVSGRGTGL